MLAHKAIAAHPYVPVRAPSRQSTVGCHELKTVNVVPCGHMWSLNLSQLEAQGCSIAQC